MLASPHFGHRADEQHRIVRAIDELQRVAPGDGEPGHVTQSLYSVNTDLDSALTLLARTHTILRRTKVPRPDPAAMKEIEDYLASNGIEVSRD